MSFPRYSAYKASGVDWLGEVPEHWGICSFRHLIKSVSNGTTVEQTDESDDTVAVSRIETISTGTINFNKVGFVASQDVAVRFLLNAGDILFSHINSLPMVGNVAVYTGRKPLLHGMNLLRLQPRNNISSDWILYWLKSKNVRQEVESRAKPAINQASISTDSVRALPALMPPESEQTQIARFLDHETAKIDALIEQQQRLIELLKEKRQAVISHAVTKGLDPTVPMKNSGVEWLGEVPAHWDVASLKMLVDVRDGTHETPSYVEPSETSFPLVTSKDVTGGTLLLDECKHISADDYYSIIRRSGVSAGDILMPMIGTVGSPFLLTKEYEIAIKNLALFRTSRSNEELVNRFLLYFLYSSECQVQFDLESRGGVQNFVSLGTLRGLRLPVPPTEEQLSIVQHLTKETSRLDSLILEAGGAIEFLNERRSALISAAVTGKIDVRNWKPPVSESEQESQQEVARG
ncbi:MAG: restriction endonuclease subunit S [Pseudohongiella sp.]|nr:restriction endonuclease subunit S [Pseudohongiella sp.]